MSTPESSPGHVVDLDEDDWKELKEITIEFLSKYDALYEKRVQKLIFYCEIKTAIKTGQRLTDATFMPYDYGPYSREVTKALEELDEEGRISIRDNGQYATALDGGSLSPKKTYLIERFHEETKRMSTDELVERAKETWLWKHFEYAEGMDFATYIDEIIMSPELRHCLEDPDRDPVEDPDIERLLS
ncbi:DUF4065 domain-containing protein [Natronorubrum sp. JWXQ-INN-674]|uniref:DUF4065 domain-containing protein n=1 Tax=Natronorubrum halalkaliphilum TaxID=2691917 RepID=A0A6B0VKV1_9EURY|nr:type II toxin-antitoxin system antitoxin SocA domain-containing protein [Natronorubrum halalkaliphilum]MXV61636.1 DUF4065 domain-containing protein [Natronorubrum halalkaliphilum]